MVASHGCTPRRRSTMDSMADAHPRNRTPAGQPTGGEFATEAKDTSTGVTLAALCGEDVPAAELRVGDRVWDRWTGEQTICSVDEIAGTGQVMVVSDDGAHAHPYRPDDPLRRIGTVYESGDTVQRIADPGRDDRDPTDRP